MTNTKDAALQTMRDAMKSILASGGAVPVPVLHIARDALAATSHIALDTAPSWKNVAERLNELDGKLADSRLTAKHPTRQLLYAILHEVCGMPAAPDAAAIQAEPIYQWRQRPVGSFIPAWHDAPKDEAYERVDERYEARTLYTSPISPAIMPEASELPLLHQVPVTTYLAPDGETRWPAYSFEQRQDYARAAFAMHRSAVVNDDPIGDMQAEARQVKLEEAVRGWKAGAAAEPGPTDLCSIGEDAEFKDLLYAYSAAFVNDAKADESYVLSNAKRDQLITFIMGWNGAATKPTIREAVCDIAKLIITKYSDKPDDYVLSIGHWRDDSVMGAPLQEFVAYMAVPMSDWRTLAAPTAPPDELRRAHALLDKYCVADLDGGKPASLETRIAELHSWYQAATPHDDTRI